MGALVEGIDRIGCAWDEVGSGLLICIAGRLSDQIKVDSESAPLNAFEEAIR